MKESYVDSKMMDDFHVFFFYINLFLLQKGCRKPIPATLHLWESLPVIPNTGRMQGVFRYM